MDLDGKVAVITGAAGGIGVALARRFKAKGARGIVLADLPRHPVEALALELGGLAVPCDMTREADVQNLVDQAESTYGAIDLFCSNAGILNTGGVDAPDIEWQDNWNVHVMAHVYAARAVAPAMAARGSGAFLLTASAAGLLSHVESATYAVTKHAGVALAEWLAIAYGDQGVRVSVLCPQGVRTAMTQGNETGVASLDGMIEPEAVANCVILALERGDFLILPHPEVREYLQRKTADYDRWLAGMCRLRARFSPA